MVLIGLRRVFHFASFGGRVKITISGSGAKIIDVAKQGDVYLLRHIVVPGCGVLVLVSFWSLVFLTRFGKNFDKQQKLFKKASCYKSSFKNVITFILILRK